MAKSSELEIAKTLSEIELSILRAIDGKMTEAQASGKANIQIDSARRAFRWLEEKGLLSIDEQTTPVYSLTSTGKKALEQELPEVIVTTVLEEMGPTKMEELMKITKLERPEFNAAIGRAKKNAWISINSNSGEPVLESTGFFEENDEKKRLLESIANRTLTFESLSSKLKDELNELMQRGLVIEEQRKTVTGKLTEKANLVLSHAKNRKQREFNLQDKVARIYAGRKQPYASFLSNIKRSLVELGFEEMESPLIVQQFYNFDVLFQPQNHPARTWSDTYFLKSPNKGKLSNKKALAAIKSAHETGGKTLSRGWGYKWDEKIAKMLMPSAHATAHSARQFVKGVKPQAKYFSLSRCYRPDVIDRTHLLEFNQLDGAVVGEDISFKHLLGILKQFAREIAGTNKVKFIPDYYPFVEPGVQLSAKHPDLGWVEFGGAGMGRPEILEPLGIKTNAIMWGLGVDRLAMFKLGLEDLRELFTNNLDWLRNQQIMEDF